MARQSIQEYVYEQLKMGIMTFRLEPGKVLSTYEISTQLSVSRTPVREAFLHLQAEHLLNMIPQKETIVSLINLKLIEQEKFIRESLEIGAVDRLLTGYGSLNQNHRLDTEKMSELIECQKKCMEEKDAVGFIRADDLFHRCLFDFTGQDIAWDVISKRNGHYNRYRVLFVQEEGGMESSIEQHCDIVRYLQAGDELKVREALQSHIRRIDLKLEDTDAVKHHSEYFTSGDDEIREKYLFA